jgi:hypothetical protein
METVHINELVNGSAIYDRDGCRDILSIETVFILERVSFVHYAFDDTEFVHVWEFPNGEIPVGECQSPTATYQYGSVEFYAIVSLLDYIMD